MQTQRLCPNSAAVTRLTGSDKANDVAFVGDAICSLAKRTLESTEAIFRIVDELTKSPSVVFIIIGNKMKRLNHITQSISGLAKQQIIKIRRLGDGVRDIDASVEENATSSSQVFIVSQGLIDLSNQMMKQINVDKTH